MSLVHVDASKLNLLVDLRYASDNNFTGQQIYKTNKFLLHPKAAEKLEKASNQAQAMGYQLKIFDAFRPVKAQHILYRYAPYPDFVSPPEKGQLSHCRGIAIDLTLVDKNSQEELEMGTGFDAFTIKSYQGNTDISEEAQCNRAMLLGIMTLCGWDYLNSEWWHFQLPNYQNYEIYGQDYMGPEICEI